MEQISSALSSIGKVASSPAGKGALDIASLGSVGYNLYNQYQNQQYQNKLRDLASNPTKMNQYAEQFTKPLNAGLTTGVANQAQSYLASHGLTDSPQISEQVEAQAIAPYIQQNQQAGYQNALQALNVGGGAVNPNSQSANTIAALAKAFSQWGRGGPGDQSSLPTLADYIRTMGTQQQQLDPSQWNPGPAPTPDWSPDLGQPMPGVDVFQAAPTQDVTYTPDYLTPQWQG